MATNRRSSPRRKKTATATPAPAPPPPPPPAEDSDDDDDTSEEEAEEEEEEKEEEDEEDDQDDEEEEEKEEEEEEDDETEEEGEDDKNDEEKEEEEKKVGEEESESESAGGDNLAAAVLPSRAAATEEERWLEPTVHEHGVLTKTIPGETLKKKFEKFWTDAMQIMLLKQMVDYSERNGNCKISEANIADFHSSLEGLPIYKFSNKQILVKMRSVKKKHDNPNGMGKGKGTVFNPTNAMLVNLSTKLWGPAGKRRSMKRKKVGDDDDDDDMSIVEGGCCLQGLSWEDGMVKLAGERFAWPDDFARLKITAMEESTRALMERKWMKWKGKLARAIVGLSIVEADCLKALL